MKETRQVTLLRCDQCLKVQQDDGLMRLGVPTLNGWFHLSRTEDKYDGSNNLGQKDFCSSKCLSQFVSELEDIDTGPLVDNNTQIDNDGCLN